MSDTLKESFEQKLRKISTYPTPFGKVTFGVCKSDASNESVLVPFIEVNSTRVQMTAQEAQQGLKVTVDFYNKPSKISNHTRLEFSPKGKGWRADKFEAKNVGRFSGDTAKSSRLATEEELKARFGKKTGTLGKPHTWQEELPSSWHMSHFSIEKAAPAIEDTKVTNATSLGANVVPVNFAKKAAARG